MPSTLRMAIPAPRDRRAISFFSVAVDDPLPSLLQIREACCTQRPTTIAAARGQMVCVPGNDVTPAVTPDTRISVQRCGRFITSRNTPLNPFDGRRSGRSVVDEKWTKEAVWKHGLQVWFTN